MRQIPAEISDAVANGTIKVVRSNGIITGIYATEALAETLKPLGVLSAPLTKETIAKAPYDMANLHYALTVSDVIRVFGEAPLDRALELEKRDKPLTQGFLGH